MRQLIFPRGKDLHRARLELRNQRLRVERVVRQQVRGWVLQVKPTGWNGNVPPIGLSFSIILQAESPGLCKSSSPIDQRLRYAAAQWTFCSLVDSNIRYDDRLRAVIYNRSVRDTE